MSPIYFIATLARNARYPLDRYALILGLLLAPFTETFAPKGLDLVVLGLVGGTSAWLATRLIHGRAQ
jgi:hypothetical protein